MLTSHQICYWLIADMLQLVSDCIADMNCSDGKPEDLKQAIWSAFLETTFEAAGFVTLMAFASTSIILRCISDTEIEDETPKLEVEGLGHAARTA
jgi:hypothetical protein